MAGTLIGIARTPKPLADMQTLQQTAVTVEAGVEGDARGAKRGRQVTVLFREGWEDACRAVPATLPWTTRRANLYVEGVERPRAVGARLKIGDVTLEVTEETAPCDLMERAQAGLRAAMTPDWRGGVCCAVISGGSIGLGDAVSVRAGGESPSGLAFDGLGFFLVFFLSLGLFLGGGGLRRPRRRPSSSLAGARLVGLSARRAATSASIDGISSAAWACCLGVPELASRSALPFRTASSLSGSVGIMSTMAMGGLLK